MRNLFHNSLKEKGIYLSRISSIVKLERVFCLFAYHKMAPWQNVHIRVWMTWHTYGTRLVVHNFGGGGDVISWDYVSYFFSLFYCCHFHKTCRCNIVRNWPFWLMETFVFNSSNWCNASTVLVVDMFTHSLLY